MTDKNQETFKASDFLTAHQYAEKNHIDQEIVERAIKELKGVMFKRGLANRPIIVKIGTSHYTHICPDPAAQKIFKEKIKQIQSRGK